MTRFLIAAVLIVGCAASLATAQVGSSAKGVAGKPAEDADRKRVHSALSALSAAIQKGRIGALKAAWHVDGTVGVLTADDMMPPRLQEKPKTIKGFLDFIVPVSLKAIGWERHQIVNVQPQKNGHVIAWVRHWDENDFRSLMKWWMEPQDDGTLKPYDYEDVSDAIRLSTVLCASFRSMRDPDLKSRANFRTFVRVIERVEFFSADKMIPALEEIDEDLLPRTFAALKHHLLGSALQDVNRDEEALEEFDRALALRPIPYAHLLKSISLNFLNRHEEGLAAAEKWAALAGNDVLYWNQVGTAYAGLEQWSKARLAFRNAIKDDPNQPFAIWNLCRHLEGDAKQEAVEAFLAMRKPALHFPEIAANLLAVEDADGLERMIKAWKPKAGKDDATVAEYERKLAELKAGGDR